jgi:diguanylate cyclase (GGDEF)-like protein/PAS domain S-box-containing protein
MVDTAVSVLYWLAGAHLLYAAYLLTGLSAGGRSAGLLQAGAAALTAMAIVGAAVWMPRSRLLLRRVDTVHTMALALCGTTILVRLAHGGRASETILLSLTVLGAGATVLSVWRLCAMTAALGAGWLLVCASAASSGEWVPYGWLLVISAGAAVLLCRSRLRRLRPSGGRRLAVISSGGGSSLATHGEIEGLWEWNLGSDTMYFSPRWRSMLGYGEADMGSSVDSWMARIHPEDSRRVLGEIRRRLSSERPNFEIEHRIRQADGAYRWVVLRGRALYDAAGRPERVVGSQTDLRRLKRTEEKLEYDARHDRLTGLANRMQLIEQIDEEIRRQREQKGYLFAVAFLNLDRFKSLNDSLGHGAGDSLLAEVGRRLDAARVPEDVIARVGGDEFVGLLRGLRDGADALARVARLRDVFAEPFDVGEGQASIAASFGLALADSSVTKAEDLLRNADLAMSRAKASAGGDRLRLFEEEMQRSAAREWQLRVDLGEALRNGELELWFQPMVGMAGGRIVGAEALLRWRREGRLVFPSEFIPVAEELGTIVQMGEWALREACRAARGWEESGADPIVVSVNVSARQLPDQSFPDLVARVLAETGLAPDRLQIELTESQLMSVDDGAPESFNRLSKMGVRTAIDDFGTGYSSLDYLRKARFKTLKIDPGFVRDLSTDQVSAPLTQSLIEMAHSLGLEVVAEGVETPEQLEFLRRHRCDIVQGYLASQPLPEAELGVLLRGRVRLLDRWLEKPSSGLTPFAGAERVRRSPGGPE